MDRDEYVKVAFAAPRFGDVDRDGDRDLSNAELIRLVFDADPSTFFHRPEVPRQAGVPGRAESQDPLGPLPDACYALLILRDEVVSVDADASVPSEADLRRIGTNEGLNSPAARAALADLERAATGLHLGFPAELRQGAVGK